MCRAAVIGANIRPGGNAVATARKRVYVRVRTLETGFHILGSLEVRSDGKSVPIAGAKQRALLARLALARGEAVSADRLIEDLWPESEPAGARKALQVRVSQLRKTLGGNGIVTRAGGYALDPCRLDLDRFEALCAEARAAGDAAARSATLAEALALWRGEPLADLAYEPFVQAEAGPLEEARLAALEDRIAADLELGRHSELMPELDALVGRHPLRERLRAQRMTALYRAGRQADALAEYRDARSTLVDQLGIEPGRELRELERRILEQDPGLDLPAAIVPSGALFVGRARELDLLGEALAATARGSGRVCLIGGEPGAGKSRLADEVARAAGARGWLVLQGRCWEAGGAPAFWPWVQSLRGWLAQTPADVVAEVVGTGAADVAQLLPELYEVLGDIPALPAPDSDGARFRLFDAVADLLCRLGRRRPVILALDDLHAGDVSSLLLLELLATRLARARVIVLGAFRTTEVEPGGPMAATLANLAREPAVDRIDLTGLSEDDVADYIAGRTQAAPAASLAAAVHRATEGNALFVTELSRMFAEEGAFAADGLDHLPIPAGVREVISRRLERLEPRCRELLQLASVLGRESDLRVLAHMSGAEPSEVLAVLEPAQRAAILQTGDRLRFSHALVRDAVYAQLPPAARGELHRSAAASLIELHAQDLDPHLAEIAHHQLEGAIGGGHCEAAEFARRAGRRAARVLAYEEAARLFERALAALERGGTTPETRCDTLLELGDAHARSGGDEAAKRAFLEVAAIARERGDIERLGRAAVGYGGRMVWLRSDGDQTLLDILDEAIAVLPPHHPQQIGLRARLAGALRDRPEREADRYRVSAEAVELARRFGDPMLLGHAFDGRYCAILSPTTSQERLDLSLEWIGVSRAAGDKERLNHAYIGLVIAYLELGDVESAQEATREMVRLAHELRQPGQLWFATGTEAFLALAKGDLDEAERLVDVAYDYGRRALPGEATFAKSMQLTMVRRAEGRSDEVLPLIAAAAEEFPARPACLGLFAAVAADLGRDRDVASVLAKGFERYQRDDEWLPTMCVLAEAASVIGDRERAAELYELILPFAHLNALDLHEMCFGSASRALGLAAAALGRNADARRHLTDAVEFDRRTGWLTPLAASEAALARLDAEDAAHPRVDAAEVGVVADH